MAKMSRVLMAGIVALALAGLFFSLTRTAWVGLAATVGLFWLLGYRSARRPWLVFGLVLSGFGAAVMGGDLLYRELFLAQRMPLIGSPIAARYLTVGTIEARTGAWDALRQVSVSTPLWGRGFGVLSYINRSPEAARVYQTPFAHNFLVDLVVGAGIPGLLLFLWFFWQWLREGFAGMARAADPRERRLARWALAFAAGQMVTGYLNGPSFLTHEFFLILGAASGWFQSARTPGVARARWSGAAAEGGAALWRAPLGGAPVAT
jgi:O-antigen ligase